MPVLFTFVVDNFDVLGGAGVNPGFFYRVDFDACVDYFRETVDCRDWILVGLLAVVACIKNFDLSSCAKVLVKWPMNSFSDRVSPLVKF